MRRLLLGLLVFASLAFVPGHAFALNGDVTADGVFDLRDPLALCRFLAGTTSSLPAAQNGDVNFDGVLTKADVDVMMLAMVGVPLPQPPLSVTPLSLDFGDVNAGADASLDILLANNGGAAVMVQSIALGAGSSGSFSIVSAPPTPATIPAGGQATVTIRYAPAMVGMDAGSVAILSGGGNVNVTLKGRGVAPVLSVAPLSLDFGDVLSGNETFLDTVVRNDGNADLIVNSIAPGPGTSADFSIHAAPATPFTLPPGQQSTVTIRYAPAQTGTDSGSIEILANGGSAAVTLAGRGVAPALDVNPTVLDFGNVIAGGSQARSFLVTNTGSAPLQVTGVALQLGGSPDFSLTPLPPTPFSIAPGGTQSVEVGYMPSGVGPDTGHVEVHTNAGDALVALTGAGVVPVIDVVPQSLDFGNVLVGQTAALPVEIINAGTADLSVSSIAFVSGGSPDLTLQNVPALPVAILPGHSVFVDVVYTPGQVGPDTATLRIESNDVSAPSVEVPVQGNGVQPGVMVHPNALVFSNVRAGHTLDLDFMITNSGSLDLTVSALALKSGTSSDFTLASPRQTPFTLTPGNAETVTVRYGPATAGADAGAVSIDTSAGAAQVDLTGSAIAPRISVTPLSLDFGNVRLGLQSTLEVTVSNIGSDTLNVSGISLSGSADFSLAAPPSVPLGLAPGDSAVLHAVYVPGQDGPDSGLLTIASDDVASPSVAVDLSGDGVSPHLVVSPASIDFGDVTIGFTRTRSVTVKNTGTGDLTLSAPSLAAGSSAAFTISSQPSLHLGPGGMTTFNVAYAPAGVAGDSGTVSIGSDGGSAMVALTGNGITGASVVSIALSPLLPTLASGDCVQMHAVALLTDTSLIDVTSVAVWSSADPGAATVGSTGLVMGVGQGVSAVSAAFGGVSVETDVTVLPAGTLRISAPCGEVSAGAAFEGEVTVDAGSMPLGSYAVRIQYDPAVVKITGIAGGLTPAFGAAPGADPSTLTSGATIFAAYQNTSLSSPSGVASVARISFEVTGGPGSSGSISLQAVTLLATDLADIPWTNVPLLVAVAP